MHTLRIVHFNELCNPNPPFVCNEINIAVCRDKAPGSKGLNISSDQHFERMLARAK